MQEKQFYSIFPNGTIYKTTLDSILLSDKLKYIQIHTALWKFYLLIFPNVDSLCVTQENWMPLIESKRKEFDQIQEKYHPPQQFDFLLDTMGPLSKNEKSKWTQYHKDNELKNMISRDTSRLFHDVQFFKDEANVENINEIIFLHLRNFPEIEYNQGFHEICAIIYYYFCHEMKIQKATDDSTDTQNASCYEFLFSSDYINADAFWVYSTIINYIFKYYEDSNDVTIISKTCYDILQIYMKRIDWDVSQKLNDSNLNIMMYQWFRILFGRVFSFDQINQMWSFIFSFYPDDKVLSNITISLILSKKDEILNCSDPTNVLIIFKNMHSDNARQIIKKVIKLQSPKSKTTTKKKDKKEKIIYRYMRKRENEVQMRKSLFDPICDETQKIIPEICVKPKEAIIEQLRKLRDSICVVSMLTCPLSNDDTIFFTKDSNLDENTENISSEEAMNINNNDIDTNNANNDNDSSENIQKLPKATSGKLTDVKVDTSLLTQEDEQVFRNKSDIFSKPTNPKNLFE